MTEARDIKYGLGGVPFPPFELNEQAVTGYEAAGLDFAAYWDNTCMTFPRSIWTADLIPAAERATTATTSSTPSRPWRRPRC